MEIINNNTERKETKLNGYENETCLDQRYHKIKGTNR